MQLIEIELHEATIIHSRVDVSYTIYDGEMATDVSQQVNLDALRNFIINKGLNEYCTDVIEGSYIALDSADYLVENLNDVVKGYLIENLK